MKTLSLAVIIAFAVGAFACGTAPTNTSTSNASTPAPAASSPVSTPVDELAGGRELYNQNCASCHKEDGTGGKMTIEGKSLNVDDLTSEKIKRFTDEKITGYIVNGVVDEGMPAFKDELTEAEIREVVKYVRRGIQKDAVKLQSGLSATRLYLGTHP